MNTEKETLYEAGVKLAERFCAKNNIPMPTVKRLMPTERLYHLATCAYYRPTTIHIMVEKCAAPGHAGRSWSWPGYVIDRTPYGVVQHELGHHLDHLRSGKGSTLAEATDKMFSKNIYLQSKEEPLTGYLGTDDRNHTFYMEWFAENFRLFVTNPDLSYELRPRFYGAMVEANINPVVEEGWSEVLYMHSAPERIEKMAERKVKFAATTLEAKLTL